MIDKRKLCSRESVKVSARLSWAALAWVCFVACAVAQDVPAGRLSPRPSSGPAMNAVQLAAFDADIASGKYGLVDSMLVQRCGVTAIDRTYKRDYNSLYGERAKKAGPMNHDPKGEYNYFSTEFHPYFRHSDLHTMQSISKTVTSITIGVAMQRKQFPVGLDTPIFKFFSAYKIANVDERKRRITLRHLLTMTSGIEWHEDLAYDDPANSSDVMEGKREWVQYVIDQPMAHEPGTAFVYSGGDTELLAYIFLKVTGKQIDAYADEHLFKPLGITHYHWKHSPTGLPDTQGGLFLAARDLAKIGTLFLKDGIWGGNAIVSDDWIRDSTAPHMTIGASNGKYGYQWWLVPYGAARDKFAWAAHGFGGQQLVIVPEYDLVAVFTGWDILPSSEPRRHDVLPRILSAVNQQHPCAVPAKPN